jgi:hypothetical protein
MKARLLVCLFMLALIAPAAGSALAQATTAGNRAASEKQIVAAERAINEAIAKGDMKTFHTHVAPDAVGIDTGGIMKIDAEFDKMMQQVKIQTWSIDNSQFYWVNDTTVLHMYRWTGKGAFQGMPIPSPVWSSTLWTSKAGKWLAVYHQETQAISGLPPAPAGVKK